MFLRRILNASLATVGLILPLVVACAIMLVVMQSRQGASVPGRTPNPAKAPSYFLGPAELLVSFDPWWAGSLGLWLKVWTAIGGTYLIAVLLAWPFIQSPWYNGAWRLFLASLFLGMLAASPWWYCLCFPQSVIPESEQNRPQRRSHDMIYTHISTATGAAFVARLMFWPVGRLSDRRVTDDYNTNMKMQCLRNRLQTCGLQVIGGSV